MNWDWCNDGQEYVFVVLHLIAVLVGSLKQRIPFYPTLSNNEISSSAVYDNFYDKNFFLIGN